MRLTVRMLEAIREGLLLITPGLGQRYTEREEKALLLNVCKVQIWLKEQFEKRRSMKLKSRKRS